MNLVQIPFKQRTQQLFKNDQLPMLLYAGQISDDPSWSFSSHSHEDLSEIIYICEGEGHFVIGNREYTARKGDLLIYNKGVVHEEFSNPDNPLKTFFCAVGNVQLEGVREGCILPDDFEPVIELGKYAYQVEKLLSEIFEELSSQVLGYDIHCRNLLISLIILIIRVVNTQDSSLKSIEPNSLGYKIKEFIDKNYTQEIALNEIATQLYISPHYMSRIFKQEVGYSPINYLIQRRIGEAKRLLLTTDLPVQEIARQVGYEQTNYFSMMFKKSVGTSPSKFRQEQLIH